MIYGCERVTCRAVIRRRSAQMTVSYLSLSVFSENSRDGGGEPEHRGSHVHPGEEAADRGPGGGLEDQGPWGRERLHPVHCGSSHGEERSVQKTPTENNNLNRHHFAHRIKHFMFLNMNIKYFLC